MIKIKNTIALVVSKLAAYTTQKLRVGSGTSLPGMIALKISPSILSSLVDQTKEELIAVTGTNGKTTTAGFIAGILKANNKKIAHNTKGANMLTGITTAMIEKSSLLGKLDVDNCLLEIDEAYLPKAADHLTPEYLLVTNLFRDQLDRYGELDTTAKKIQNAIDKFTLKKQTKVLLNADDPMVASLAYNQKEDRVYYGFENITFLTHDSQIKSPQETVNCSCGEKYNYSKSFYGHIGHYNCSCGIKRPEPMFKTSAEILPSGSLIKCTYNEQELEFQIKMPGLYNAYNALAAITMALCLEINPNIIKDGLMNYETVFGRAESINLDGKDVIIQLIKNPIGATEVLRTVKDDTNSKLLIIINDNYADGRDVSWLWDANFELLNNYTKTIITSGERAADMAVRLKYAGIPAENIEIKSDIKTAIEQALDNIEDGEKLYIMPTYTALLNMQKILKDF